MSSAPTKAKISLQKHNETGQALGCYLRITTQEMLLGSGRLQVLDFSFSSLDKSIPAGHSHERSSQKLSLAFKSCILLQVGRVFTQPLCQALLK